MMTIGEMTHIKKSDVEVELSGDASAITVRLAGNADTRVKEDIRGFLEKTHQLASEQHIPKVLVDFRQLEFMNSACFKAFVTWLAMVRGLEAEKQYRIHFLANDKIHWQRRSLRALSCFASNVVSVEN